MLSGTCCFYSISITVPEEHRPLFSTWIKQVESPTSHVKSRFYYHCVAWTPHRWRPLAHAAQSVYIQDVRVKFGENGSKIFNRRRCFWFKSLAIKIQRAVISTRWPAAARKADVDGARRGGSFWVLMKCTRRGSDAWLRRLAVEEAEMLSPLRWCPSSQPRTNETNRYELQFLATQTLKPESGFYVVFMWIKWQNNHEKGSELRRKSHVHYKLFNPSCCQAVMSSVMSSNVNQVTHTPTSGKVFVTFHRDFRV